MQRCTQLYLGKDQAHFFILFWILTIDGAIFRKPKDQKSFFLGLILRIIFITTSIIFLFLVTIIIIIIAIAIITVFTIL